MTETDYLSFSLGLETSALKTYRRLQGFEQLSTWTRAVFVELAEKYGQQTRNLSSVFGREPSAGQEYAGCRLASDLTDPCALEAAALLGDGPQGDLDALHLAKGMELCHWNFHLRHAWAIRQEYRNVFRELLKMKRSNISLLGESFLRELRSSNPDCNFPVMPSAKRPTAARNYQSDDCSPACLPEFLSGC